MINVKDIDRIVEENREEAQAFLTECLRTPSVTGDEKEMGQVMTKWVKAAGLDPECYEKTEGRPNIVAKWQGSKPGKQFVFNGHMDVFPPVAGNPGLYGPWSGKVVDGRIYGRGAVDMKSGLCAGLMAIKYLKELGYDPNGSVLFTAVSDEENSGIFGTKFLIAEGHITGDFGVCMEPTYGRVLIRHCGGFSAKVTYRSAAGHTSLPHPTIDALSKSIKAILKLQELGEEVKRTYDEGIGASSLLSVTMMESGNTANMYPSESWFVIDRRLLPGEDLKTEHARVRAALDELKEEYPDFDYDYQYEILGEYPPLVVDKDEEIVTCALKAFSDITGKETSIYQRGGGSDASDVMTSLGLPMPNFGPGDAYEESCSENESILLEEYFTFIKIYMRMVVKALG